ncbi:hypothetical protein [Streptomyces sp. AGS-58]|uniref:hypothetical protein n=1 Tax=unclassified Streptomyces TaxID=2593676 RepID=UPI0035A3ADDC
MPKNPFLCQQRQVRGQRPAHRTSLGSPEQALDCVCGLYLDRSRKVTDGPGPADDGLIRVPVGLVVLVGPPASGKTRFVRALIAGRQIDAETVGSAEHSLAGDWEKLITLIDPKIGVRFDNGEIRIRHELPAEEVVESAAAHTARSHHERLKTLPVLLLDLRLIACHARPPHLEISMTGRTPHGPPSRSVTEETWAGAMRQEQERDQAVPKQMTTGWLSRLRR